MTIRYCARAICLFLTVVGCCCSSFAANKIEKSTLTYAGHARTFYFFAPETADRMPLILLLHGSGRNGRIMVDEWKRLAEKEHFIVVAPDSLKPEVWNANDDSPAFIHDVIEKIKSEHPVDAGRMYLFGHSGGAGYALILALLESEYFAAAAIHAGAMHKENANLFDYAKRKMPIAIWVGDKDQNFPPEVINSTKEMFKARGFDLAVSEMRNHDHNYYIVSAQVNAEAWEFLKRTELKEPHYEEYLQR